MSKRSRRLPPVHPGEILRQDLMKPLGLSINRLARDLRVPVTRMSEIVNGRRSISADTALRLARYFGSSPQLWMNLQAAYDLDVVRRASAIRIERDVHPREACAYQKVNLFANPHIGARDLNAARRCRRGRTSSCVC